MQDLDLSYNTIEFLPQSIKGMPQLCTLNISHNLMTWLPELDGLHALWYFNASNNALEDIPSSLADSTKLSHVDVSWNHLKLAPSWLRSLVGEYNRVLMAGDVCHQLEFNSKAESGVTQQLVA